MSVDWCVLLYIIHTQAGGGGVGGGNVVDGMMGTVANDVQTQELAAKISENAQLHLQVSFSWYVSTLYVGGVIVVILLLQISELNLKSERISSALEAIKAKLEVYVHTQSVYNTSLLCQNN